MKKCMIIAAAVASILSAAEVVSTADQQTGLNLTVYNSNRGLVSQKRSVELPAGVTTLRYSDIAASVMPQTVIVENGKGVTVLEQNYEYDLISHAKLLSKYVGKEVTIVQENEYTGKSESKKAKLLSVNGEPVFEMDGEIHLGIPGRIVLPDLPENLYARPTMNWMMHAEKAGKKDISVSYLTNNISWKADYVLNLAEDDKSASLVGWVTMDNKSGTDFNDATLKLVAGDVNTVQENSYAAPSMRYARMAKSSIAESAPTQKEFFEYHLYTYPRKITVRNNQNKQLSLLNAAKVKTEKKYVVHAYDGRYQMGKAKTDLPVNVNIEFKTGKRNGIDMPVPAGVIRLYKKDDDGSAVFLGEDRVKHTPINEEVSLKIGKAFDIKADTKQTFWEQNSLKTRASYEVEVRNHKKENVTVEVMVPVYGEWKIINAPTYRKLNSTLIAFDVKVPASGKTKLNYTVEIKR